MEKAILIIDDEMINRAILANGFCDEYDIIEAEDGEEGIAKFEENHNLAAVFLDIMMPKKDGIEVLKVIKSSGRMAHLPVFMITAETSEPRLMEAYHLGAVDILYKPFMMNFVKCRVDSILELYRHRNELAEVVSEQVQKINNIYMSMVETLASLIEFRDCESGEHVRRMCSLTDIIMTKVSDMFPEYHLERAEIDKIVKAAVLHDIGKIAIPDGILNKPGRLTPEEYEIMKMHTVKGCEMLSKLPDMLEKGIYNYSYDICRHHHERWDGRGYPDGLKGDDISIWAQVVAVADVYDALTSPRVYKDPFDHEKAVSMIYNNECGVFNPKVLEAFGQCMEQILNRDV